jgi:hypothetical protein
MDFLNNAAILGLIATALVWGVRKLGWAEDSKQAAWLTLGVAFVLAAIQQFTTIGWDVVFACELGGEPLGVVQCVQDVVSAVAEQFGKVLLLSQAIYQLLRRAPVTGDRI